MARQKQDPHQDKVIVRTPNVKGYSHSVDAKKYYAMKTVLLKIMPQTGPGLTQTEMFAAAARKAPQALFPGTTLNWWVKCVQLDLEAQHVLSRDGAKPLRWRLS